MRKQYDDELTTEQREKMKKNLVYVGIFSVVMIFAGLTSAYIVSMGDLYWVKFDLPAPFWISTALLIISSISLEVGIRLGQRGVAKAVKIFVPLTFVLGVGFAIFQVKGYYRLFDDGAHFTSDIMVYQGRYGDYYQLKIDGKYMDVDGSEYILAGKPMNAAQKADVSKFAKQLESVDTKMPATIQGYGKYTLLYKNEEVSLKNGKFYVSDTAELQNVDLHRLAEFSWHLRDGRGDFFHKGKLGKDFHLYYKGQELQYKERTLYYKGSKLKPPMQLKLNDAPDQATSYLFIITLLHLLHVLGTLIYMLRMSIRSFTGKLAEHNYLSIRSGAIFWHFLGVLWIYLLLFLLFIH
jgi:cytochrome c oxidase subunit 3